MTLGVDSALLLSTLVETSVVEQDCVMSEASDVTGHAWAMLED